MNLSSTIELRDLRIETDIGTYGPDDTVPDHHWLDLTLEIRPERVLIDTDGMDRVFDYDPLVVEIDRLAADGHYETQERLMTRIVQACAACPDVIGLEIGLRKTPVRQGSGSLGVRLRMDAAALAPWREPTAGL
ncbi:MAG: dihydroneopterin aldolase [Hydrogenophaga sp.]|nr:dihydroneopterin aldolase [Hydrogenophaga sp.]